MGEHSTTGEGQQTQQNAEQLAQELERLKATNARLLEESKSYKDKYSMTKAEQDKIERDRLEAEGNHKKMLELERERLKAIEADNKALKQMTLRSKVKDVVAKLAGEVHDLDDVLNQPKYSHILKEGINEESLEVSEEAAKRYVEEVLKAKPHLKKTNANVGVVNAKGVGMINKPLAEMSADEIKKTALALYGRKK